MGHWAVWRKTVSLLLEMLSSSLQDTQAELQEVISMVWNSALPFVQWVVIWGCFRVHSWNVN